MGGSLAAEKVMGGSLATEIAMLISQLPNSTDLNWNCVR